MQRRVEAQRVEAHERLDQGPRPPRPILAEGAPSSDVKAWEAIHGTPALNEETSL